MRRITEQRELLLASVADGIAALDAAVSKVKLGDHPRVAVVGVGPLTEGASGRYDSAIADLDEWAALGARRSTTDQGVGVVHPAKPIDGVAAAPRCDDAVVVTAHGLQT